MTEHAGEYGAALFLLAKESDTIDAYAEALALVDTVFGENPDYLQLLSSPNIPKAERLTLLSQAFSDTLPTHVMSFLKLLCENGLIRAFMQAKTEFDERVAEERRILEATVTSVVPLTDAQKQTLIAKLERQHGHTVRATYVIDETLLGGVVIQIGDTILDGSLKRQIRHLKEVISQ